MLHLKISPLSEKIVNYLSEYSDYVFHSLCHTLKGHSDAEIIASLDELDMLETVSLRHFVSKEVDSEEKGGENKPRLLDISAIEGRMEIE